MSQKKMNLGPLAGGAEAQNGSCGQVARDDTAPKASKARRSYAAQMRWHAAHPWAGWAHAAERSALRRGLIERKPCEVCGAEPADAHHEGEGNVYSSPLANVRFLCRRHQRQWHAERRRAAK